MRPDRLLLRRVLVTLAALAGLFAMHGMADHGIAAAPLPATSAHHGMPASAEQPGQPEHPGGMTGHGMAELCLALLVLAAAGLVAGRALRGRVLVLGRRLARPRWRVLVARAARFRDPPDLLRLSVQRC